MSDRVPANDYAEVFAAVAAREQEAASYVDILRVLVLRNITVEGLDTLLKHHLHSLRIRAEVTFGGYGTMVQDVLRPEGAAAATRPDLIVLALSLDEIDPTYGRPGWTADAARSELATLFRLLAERTHATVAVHTFLPPLWAEQGLLLDRGGRDLHSQVDVVNRYVVEMVRELAPRFVLVDLERLLRRLGADAALDSRGRYLWRAPFRRPLLDAWAHQLSRVVAALKGRAKKVLVLDCDNTLWGGVIGEDGLEGIALDPNQYPGRAYVDFQANVLHLAERGVLLALCSKNNEADVFQVLEQHPHCLLKRSHLSGWRVNWQDKASNIAELAEELNLGLDALVFVDDNQVECDLVAKMLPAVTTLQVPKKLPDLPPLLLASGLFDTLHVTNEDRARATLYQGEAQRKSERGAFADLDEYLASLRTVAEIHRARPGELARVAQLTQKTNQFNLTTRRYSEPEIGALAGADNAAVYSMTVHDRFGTLGLVGVLIARVEGTSARVDTFLISCRALGRRLEEVMAEFCLADLAAGRALRCWCAEYLPTAKNAQAADFWARRGFVETSRDASGIRYERDVAAAPSVLPDCVTICKD